MSARQINKVLLRALGLVLYLAVSGSAVYARNGSILFVNQVYEEPRFLVDPVYQEKLEADGWHVGYTSLDRLDWQVLHRFNVLVLAQHPDTVRTSYRHFIDEKRDLLLKFLNGGGGVLVFADLNRSRVYPYWNDLMRPFGITINPDIVVETDPAKRQRLKAYYSQEAFLTTNILPSPITEGVNELWCPKHGTVTFDAGEDWLIAVRASKTARTEDAPEATAVTKTYESEPPIVAHRQYGAGRIVVFSSHSSWYTLNPYHFMWDKGFFLNNGQGYRLLANIYAWLAQPSTTSESLGGFAKSEQKQLYDLQAQRKESHPETVEWTMGGTVRKALVGVQSTYSNGKYTVREFADVAQRFGIDMLVFTERAEAMDKANWQKFAADCKAASTDAFLALPGVRFTGLETKNQGVAFNLKKPWYEIPYAETGFHTYIRIGVNTLWRSNVATVAPSTNPISIYNTGAITGYTLFSYEGTKLVDTDVDTFLQTNGEGWGLFPMTYAAIDDPGDIENLQDAYFTYFYSNRWGTDYEPKEDSLLQSFVSNGPVIDYLKHQAPHPWIALDDRVLTCSFKAHSDVPIRKVTAIGSGKMLRTFHPNAEVVEASFRYRTNEEIYFYIVVTDQNRHTAYSRTIVDYRLRYHHFIGTDRMNGYWYPLTHAEPEVAYGKLDGRYGRIGTGLFPGLGWGDQVPIRTGSQQNNYPLGLETGPPQGGLSGVELTPLIHINGKAEFQEAAPYRRVSLNSTDCIVLRDTIDKTTVHSKDEESGRTTITTPPSEYLRGDVVATAFRCPSTFLMTIEANLEAKQGFDVDANQPNYTYMIPYAGYADTYDSIVSKNGSQPVQVVDHVAPAKYELAGNSFVGLTDNPFGVGALFTFDPAVVHIRHAGRFPQLYAFPRLQDTHVSKGRKIHSKYLLVLTQGDDGNAADIFKTVYDKYGFDGTLASTITVQTGTLISSVLTPEFEAAEYGVRAAFTQAELPAGLGLKVHGLKSNWDVSLYDAHAGQLVRNIAMDEGVAYVNLDVSHDRDVFIGNIVTSNRDEILINVYDASPERLDFAVHNPTESVITATVKSESGLAVPTVTQEVTLLAGETKDFRN